MNAQFYDLNIETLEDKTIRLEQKGYSGEIAIIDLHPAQATFIADSLKANAIERNQAPPNGAAERIATLERRLLWMQNRFEECREALPSDMFERCAEAFEFDSWLAASIDVAAEFCADFPDAPSNAPSNAHASPLAATADLLGECLPGAIGCSSGLPEGAA